MINAGEFNDLKVLRKSDLGYMLSDGQTEILLHFKEANGLELKDGDDVSVFVYYDKKKRLTATTNKPGVLIGQPGFVTVVESVSDIGVFIDINCGKDVLISKDYLPYDMNKWPMVGDTLLVELRVKRETMQAKPLNRFDIIAIRDTEHKYALDEIVEAYVCRIGDAGIGAVTKDKQYVFIHSTKIRGDYRIGQLITPKIIMVKDEEYNGSLIENKENMIDSDSQIIIDYLKHNNDTMNLTAKSSSEDIFKTLKLSRKAFKRALGYLYKEQIVDCLPDETILIKKEL